MPNGFVSFVRFVFFKKNTFAPHHHFVVPIDFASLIFLLLVRQSINKFILCSYLVRRFSL